MIRLLCLFVTSLLLGGCQDGPSSQPPLPGGVKHYKLATAVVEQRLLPIIHPVPGTVVAKEQLQLASRITGFIERITVDEGDLVEPGAILVKIDGAQIEAAIRGVEAMIRSARVELDDAKNDLQRFRTLSDSRVLSEDQLRDAVVRQTKAEAALAQAQAELEVKQQDLRYIQLVSPVRAQVRERLSDPGDLATAGAPILRLDVLSTLELEVYLSASQVGQVSKGKKVEIFFPSDSGAIPGEVSRIVRSADNVTRRSKVRITLPDDPRLSPGQFARANFQFGQEKVPMVPLPAIVERAGIQGVFVVSDDRKVRFRSIRIGKVWQGYGEILAGLDVKTEVVLDPPARLRDGNRIGER